MVHYRLQYRGGCIGRADQQTNNLAKKYVKRGCRLGEAQLTNEPQREHAAPREGGVRALVWSPDGEG